MKYKLQKRTDQLGLAQREDNHYLPFWLLTSASCLLTITGMLTCSNQRVFAQLTPDSTLGQENSIVNKVNEFKDLINGGATRGANLFHSFQEFNVDIGKSVYFANPTGIENILTRVTGANVSNIFGKLGVEGTANLFLINPNGILFGKNASLDIRGSFTATTANSIKLGENGLFSATHPQSSNLLTIQPGALFVNALKNQQAEIRNEGNLQIGDSKTLTLLGVKVNISGELTSTGGTIQILGKDINLVDNALINVSSPTNAGNVFIGGNFQGKGKISNALNTYIGEGVKIKADSLNNGNGGNVIVWADRLTGFYGDITAKGGQFSGNGGFVEVSGKDNLIFRGNVDTSAINGLTGTLLIDPTDIIIADGSGTSVTDTASDTQTIYKTTLEGLSGNNNLILEANNNIFIQDLTDNQLNLNGGLASVTFIADADQDGVGDFTMIDQADTIKTNKFLGLFLFPVPGRNLEIKGVNLTIGNIDTSSYIGGGNITLTAIDNIAAQSLNASAVFDGNRVNAARDGGTISLLAGGSITTQSLNSRAYSALGNVGNGGDITLTSFGNISTDYLDSSSNSSNGNVGNGGNITLISSGNISTQSLNSSASSNENTGNGGNINLTSSGNLFTQSQNSSASSTFGNTGNSGNITITSSGNISTQSLNSRAFSTFGGNTGNSGNITITSSGNISTESLDSSLKSDSDGLNYSGSISLIADGDIFTQSLNSRADSAEYGSAGNSGLISLIAGGDISTESVNSGSFSDFGNAGNGGVISVNAGGNISAQSLNSQSLSSSGKASNGGTITLQANGNIFTQSLNSSSFLSSLLGAGNIGNGGIISLTAGGDISTQSLNSYSSSVSSSNVENGGAMPAAGGAIALNSGGSISVYDLNSYSFSNGGTVENGGAITLNANKEINLRNINASGKTGSEISIISQTQDFSLENFTINSNAKGNGNGGNIFISAPSVNLTKTELTTTSAGIGNAGKITIKAENTVFLEQSRLFTSLDPGAVGNGGEIRIEAGTINLTNLSFIDTASFGQGQAGNVFLIGKDAISLNNSNIFSISAGIGDGGNVQVKAGGLISLSNQSNISTIVSNRAIGNGGNVSIDSSTLSLTEGSQLQALTKGQGNSGNIQLHVKNGINISGIGNDGFLSGVFTSSEANSQGQGGNIEVKTAGTLLVEKGAVLNAQTASIFNGGDITVNAKTLELRDGGQLLTNTFNSGNAGKIIVNANDGVLITDIDPNFDQRVSPPLPIRDNVPIRHLSILNQVNPNNSINTAQALEDNSFSLDSFNDINPDVELSSKIPYVSISGQFAAVDEANIYSFQVTAGTRGIFDIDNGIKLGDSPEPVKTFLQLLDSQGRVLAENNSNSDALGAGGSNSYNLDPYLKYIFTQSGTYFLKVIKFPGNQYSLALGSAATVTFLNSPTGTYNLQVSLESPSIAASVINNSANSGLFARTEGSGVAGDISINTNNLQIANNALLSAKTASSGNGGSVIVNTNTFSAVNGGQLITTTSGSAKAGNIIMKVKDNITLDGEKTGLFANTEPGSTGDGGSVNIDPETFIIKNGAGIGVNSQGSGKGGNISLQAGTLSLDNQAFITAETASNQGGEINLNIQDLLLLRNNSRITATAGTNGAGGDGGNININAPFIVAFPNENSDITANAFQGNGGQINITTNAIFGLEYRPQLTPKSDITASSQFGLSGQVTINRLDVDPSKGLVTLPSSLIDPTSQLAQGCKGDAKIAGQQNKFTIVGRGGLPSNPSDLLTGTTPLVDLVDVVSSQEITKQEITPVVMNNEHKNIKPPLIQEAQGWIITADGKVILTAEAQTVTPQNSGLNHPGCHISSQQ
ncbi:two-partner secretion domain-containing protein [Anabaena sp. WFMT]|uniref:two-partner secretion domain-containing protein n=1 Tax=Anabaena sp. WFMT TaxID=3449730 RepID=UPI003F254F86